MKKSFFWVTALVVSTMLSVSERGQVKSIDNGNNTLSVVEIGVRKENVLTGLVIPVKMPRPIPPTGLTVVNLPIMTIG